MRASNIEGRDLHRSQDRRSRHSRYTIPAKGSRPVRIHVTRSAGNTSLAGVGSARTTPARRVGGCGWSRPVTGVDVRGGVSSRMTKPCAPCSRMEGGGPRSAAAARSQVADAPALEPHRRVDPHLQHTAPLFQMTELAKQIGRTFSAEETPIRSLESRSLESGSLESVCHGRVSANGTHGARSRQSRHDTVNPSRRSCVTAGKVYIRLTREISKMDVRVRRRGSWVRAAVEPRNGNEPAPYDVCPRRVSRDHASRVQMGA